ncbi:MAG: glutamate--tRNA ligase [Geminicoccaceae bacterium]|nr:glutamate--tRNA ligase [Geminicoccaceae bacterium]
MPSPKVRFAPSPTGRLHLGNVRTALANRLFTQRQGGTAYLRIDDTDRTRSGRDLERHIESDLAWLGLDFVPAFRQSERTGAYEAAFDRLAARGFVYPCDETADELEAIRRDRAARGLPPAYRRSARTNPSRDADQTNPGVGLSQTNPSHGVARANPSRDVDRTNPSARPYWRFALPDGEARFADLIQGARVLPFAAFSDPVVRRADGGFTYAFASVVDDADLAITHLIRGEDHLSNTAVQLALFDALGAARPETAHLPLLRDADGGPLSKRLGSLGVADLRGEGIEPLAILRHLAVLGTGNPPDPSADLEGLARTFDLAAFNRAPARLNLDEIRRLSLQIQRNLPFAAVRERLEALGIEGVDEPLWLVCRDNVGGLGEMAGWVRVVRGPIEPVREDVPLLEAGADLLPDRLGDEADAGAWLDRVKAATGRKGRGLFHPLRLAATGRDDGPGLKLLLPLVGPDRLRRRLRGEIA